MVLRTCSLAGSSDLLLSIFTSCWTPGMITLITTVIVLSVSVQAIAREREFGTYDELMALPMRPMLRQGGGRIVDIGNDWFARFAEAYVIEAEAWVASLRAGVVTGPSVWDGLMAQTIVEAGLASIASGGPITLDRPATPALYR